MKNNYMTFEETDRLKGLLILLVIMGHIEQFFSGDKEKLQMLLYSFHVVSFFYLPFLFNKDTFNLKNIKKNFRRIYIPYTLFYFISVLIYGILYMKPDISSAVFAWLIGTAPLIKANAGFAIFWFFPALISTIILLLIYNSLTVTRKKLFIVLIIFSHIFIPTISSSYLIYFPLGSYVSLYLFIIGIIIKYIYYNYDWKSVSPYTVLFSFIFLLYLVYGTRFNLASPMLPNILEHPGNFLLHDLIFIVGFFSMIYLSRSLVIFGLFGKYSLALFTIHPFVIQIVNRLYNWSSILDGFIKFILVVLISFILVKIIYLLKINKYIYPR